jgi:hypothetical protein
LDVHAGRFVALHAPAGRVIFVRTMSAYQAAAYYFPNFHPGDPRNERWHGKGWTEWELLKRAEPRFPGHRQPRVPAWGYTDESDPLVMAKKIDAAADAGLTAFIFDWYWYEDGPYLAAALDRGFLGARNNERLRFSLMWANHDWVDIHPASRCSPPGVLQEGIVSPKAFFEAADHMIATYFGHPSYWRPDGRAYLSFYMIAGLVAGFGTVAETRRALEELRRRARSAGCGGLHLNAVVWGEQILPGEKRVEDVNGLLDELGFDSITSYVWIHHQPLPSFPTVPYDTYREANVRDYVSFRSRYRLPYFPNVTMGWDSSPRTIQSDVFENLGYPWIPVLEGNTPAEFERALRSVTQFLDQGGTVPPVFTVNAWNEWTEGSYLEPDSQYGLGYLEALRRVVGPSGK